MYQDNIDIFNDTLLMISEESELSSAVESSIERQFVWKEGETFPNDKIFCKNDAEKRTAKVVVSSKRTFEAARYYAIEGKKVCVLNFANSIHIGGGVQNGSRAQEESLCRCSTLYPCISSKKTQKEFYEYHSDLLSQNKFGKSSNDDLIYSPDVVVIKTDTFSPERLEKNDWYKTDVVTCAAPIFQGESDDKIQAIFVSRFHRIFESAKQAGCDVVILGAFGCGAFGNSPKIVATSAKMALSDFEGDFETVEFAIFHAEWEKQNYIEFEKIFC